MIKLLFPHTKNHTVVFNRGVRYRLFQFDTDTDTDTFFLKYQYFDTFRYRYFFDTDTTFDTDTAGILGKRLVNDTLEIKKTCE